MLHTSPTFYFKVVMKRKRSGSTKKNQLTKQQKNEARWLHLSTVEIDKWCYAVNICKIPAKKKKLSKRHVCNRSQAWEHVDSGLQDLIETQQVQDPKKPFIWHASYSIHL